MKQVLESKYTPLIIPIVLLWVKTYIAYNYANADVLNVIFGGCFDKNFRNVCCLNGAICDIWDVEDNVLKIYNIIRP